jgi:DNA-binding transcriptional ArsR family regulator
MLGADTIEQARRQADQCRVFGSTRRILILWALIDHPLSVGEVAEAIDSSLQNTSQHLRLMKDKGILTSRREGSTVYYEYQHNPSNNLCPQLLETGKQIHNYKRKPIDTIDES